MKARVRNEGVDGGNSVRWISPWPGRAPLGEKGEAAILGYMKPLLHSLAFSNYILPGVIDPRVSRKS